MLSATCRQWPMLRERRAGCIDSSVKYTLGGGIQTKGHERMRTFSL